MFCTNCGRRITISESRCPFCGAEQEKLEGGNSFWDMVDGGQRSTLKKAVDMGVTNSPTVIKECSKAPVILSVIALIVSIVGLFSIATVKKNADSRMTGYDDNIINTAIAEEEDRNRIAELETQNQELEMIVDAVQTELEQVKSAISTPVPEEIELNATENAEIPEVAESPGIVEVLDMSPDGTNAQDQMIPEEALDKDGGINTFEPEQSLADIFGN